MKVVYNPGGFSAQRHCIQHELGRSANRHRYTNAEKLAILHVLENLMLDNGMTQAQAADVLCVDTSCLTRWAQKKDELGAEPKKMHKLSEHTGHNSLLHNIKLDLLNFIKEWRQKGFDVNRLTLLREECRSGQNLYLTLLIQAQPYPLCLHSQGTARPLQS